jgi:hypothetical protein
MDSETSGINVATRCNNPEDIRHINRHANTTEDSVLRPCICEGLL